MIYKLIARYPHDQSRVPSWQKRGSPGSQFKKWVYVTVTDLKKYRSEPCDFSNIHEFDLELHFHSSTGGWSKIASGDVSVIIDKVKSLPDDWLDKKCLTIE